MKIFKVLKVFKDDCCTPIHEDIWQKDCTILYLMENELLALEFSDKNIVLGDVVRIFKMNDEDIYEISCTDSLVYLQKL